MNGVLKLGVWSLIGALPFHLVMVANIQRTDEDRLLTDQNREWNETLRQTGLKAYQTKGCCWHYWSEEGQPSDRLWNVTKAVVQLWHHPEFWDRLLLMSTNLLEQNLVSEYRLRVTLGHLVEVIRNLVRSRRENDWTQGLDALYRLFFMADEVWNWSDRLHKNLNNGTPDLKQIISETSDDVVRQRDPNLRTGYINREDFRQLASLIRTGLNERRP